MSERNLENKKQEIEPGAPDWATLVAFASDSKLFNNLQISFILENADKVRGRLAEIYKLSKAENPELVAKLKSFKNFLQSELRKLRGKDYRP